MHHLEFNLVRKTIDLIWALSIPPGWNRVNSKKATKRPLYMMDMIIWEFANGMWRSNQRMPFWEENTITDVFGYYLLQLLICSESTHKTSLKTKIKPIKGWICTASVYFEDIKGLGRNLRKCACMIEVVNFAQTPALYA